MASTMLTGDKRWAPTRKSGMTVLGKVPKPINLPSQRLENHGLDPNVEIVPKGTLTWGSRPSATAPNVWASSSALLSPNTDGSSGSPSHLNGRPSSGGGTRPSTAGSDRSHEPAPNPRGPNSRPSSASGSLISNQTSLVSTRPRSAEPRPSSAHLSRFAETSVESTVAWGPTRTAGRVGSASSKANEFSLSSGDFPTLGSEINSDSHSQRGHSSHDRPGSSSGTTPTHKEAVKPFSTGHNVDEYSEHGNTNSWKKEGYPFVGGPPPNMNWQRDPQQAHPYPSGNVPPQHFSPWHGAPIHSPEGVWYRGGAVSGPYRPAGPPGGYPVEPYACYPQFSSVGGPYRPSSEPVPKPGAGPGGYNLKNGEPYDHHQLPDHYIVPSYPVIPIRPGAYTSPIPFEGYYGLRPARLCNPNEHQLSVRGMPDHDTEKLHVIPDGHPTLMTKEHREPIHVHETHPGQYRILLKQHDSSETKGDAQDRKEQSVLGSLPQFDREVLPGTANGEEDWRRNQKNDERRVHANLQAGKEDSSQRANAREGRPMDPVIPNLLVNSSVEKPENTTFRPTKKNASLIEKLEGLNNKTRSADGRSGCDEKVKQLKVVNKADHSRKVITTDVASPEQPATSGAVISVSETGKGSQISSSDTNYSSRTSEPLPFAVGKPGSSEIGEKSQSQVPKRAHVMRGRSDDKTKLSSDSDVANESIKRSSGSNTLVSLNMTIGGSVPGLQVIDSCTPENAAGDHVNSTVDLMDPKAQRAKLKEIAMRRAKELQEEEEERTREQRAKALAKLEELNRRTLAQTSNQKMSDSAPINDALLKEEEEEPVREQKEDVLTKPEESPGKTMVKRDAIVTEAPDPLPVQSSSSLIENSVGSNDQSTHSSSSDLHESNVSKRKHTGSRRRANISKEESKSEKPTAAESITSPKHSGEFTILPSSSDSLPEENSAPHRKKGNRNARNKSRTDEAALVGSTFPNPKGDLDKGPIVVGEAEPLPAVSKASQWKPHSVKRPIKNQQARPADKFHGGEAVVWAPVRPSSRNEPSGEASQKVTPETNSIITSGKNEHDEQNNIRTKRAEMERYVPKPVAKELSQLNSLEPSPALDQAASGNVTSKPDSCGSHPETGARNGESSKPSKRGKMRASWRQRNTVESPPPLENSTKPMGEPSDQKLPECQFPHDDWNTNNDNLVPAGETTSPVVIKDQQRVPNRQRRQHLVLQERRQSAPVDDKDQWSEQDGKFCTQSPAVEFNESFRKNVPRAKGQGQGAGSEQMKPHWQPKSQDYSHADHHEIRTDGRQKIGLNGDKRRGKIHFEYQPIGSYSKGDESFQPGPMINEEAREGLQAPGLRYRERGQNRPRRGGVGGG